MPEKPRDDQEPVDALELLDDAAPAHGPPQPIPLAPLPPAAKSPRPADDRRPASRAPAAQTPRAPTRHATPPTDDDAPPPADMPRFRCLHCGYPLLEGGDLRCTECGRTYTADTLEHWFGGDEQQRFDQVLWMVLASLFAKLLMPLPLPGIPWCGRAGAALALGWACHLANRGKQATTGGYYAIAGMFTAAVMFLVFSWPQPGALDDLAFHTLDMIGGCVLLMAMLSDPFGGDVAGAVFSKRLTPIILFATPVFAGVSWVLHAAVGTQFGTLTLPDDYAPFGVIAPYLAAAAVWLFVWRTLAAIRRTLFGAPEQQP
jgi:hypothetical protein